MIGRGRSHCAYLAVFILAALLSACEQLTPALTPIEAPRNLQPAPPRISGAIPSGRERLPAFESRGFAPMPRAAAQPSAGPTEAGDVALNFVDTDIREIVRVILGNTLKANYSIDPGVQGTATLEIGRPLPRSQLLPTLEMLLNQNGATLTERNGIYRISPTSSAAAVAPITTDTNAFSSGTQIVSLRYASATDLAKLLEPYVSTGGKITADATRNALIVTGDPTVRQALIAMIRAFDVDVLTGQSYALFPAGEGNAETLASELRTALRSDGEGALSGVVRVVPMQRVNAVLVVSSQPRYIDEARRLIALERRAADATTRSWHVYYVQNGQSADLETLLQRAFTPGQISTGAAPPPPGGTAPGAQPLTMTGARGGLGQGQTPAAATGPGGNISGGLGSLSPSAQNPPPAATPAEAAPATAATGAENEDRIRIIADRRRNALLIYATPREYGVVEGMLRKIDIVPLQVLIEATIAEVTLDDTLNYGTQFFLGQKAGAGINGTLIGPTPSSAGIVPNSIATIAGMPITYAPNFPGFVLNNGVREVINALASVTKVKVLSAPEVMVLDNEPARLQVGNIVPVLTQSQQSTIISGAPIVNSIQYRDTGVILLVTPQVNSGGLVTLDLSQEVSDVLTTSTGEIPSPTFDQRLIRTRVAIQDGQTVGLAGLIRDKATETNSGIPILKDIPLLGGLVSGQQNQRDRTELLVLITPHVVHDQRDARALTEDLRGDLTNPAVLRQELQTKPQHGSANPNRF